MDVQKITRITQTTTTTDLEYMVVQGDAVVYKVTTSTQSDTPVISEFEGITSLAGIKDFKKGAPILPPYPVWGPAVKAILARPELLSVAREQGWRNTTFDTLVQMLLHSPYTIFANKPAFVPGVVFLDLPNHQIYDMDGLPLPVAMEFSYVDGHYDNATYHLDKALEILRKRDDIRFVAPDRYGQPNGIHRIPDYNAVNGRTHGIRFVWMPAVEDYRRMMAKYYEMGGYNRHHAVFECDMFGLRAGGAAKYTDFFGRDY